MTFTGGVMAATAGASERALQAMDGITALTNSVRPDMSPDELIAVSKQETRLSFAKLTAEMDAKIYDAQMQGAEAAKAKRKQREAYLRTFNSPFAMLTA